MSWSESPRLSLKLGGSNQDWVLGQEFESVQCESHSVLQTAGRDLRRKSRGVTVQSCVLYRPRISWAPPELLVCREMTGPRRPKNGSGGGACGPLNLGCIRRLWTCKYSIHNNYNINNVFFDFCLLFFLISLHCSPLFIHCLGYLLFC